MSDNMDRESAKINAEVGWLRIRAWIKQAIALVGLAMVAIGVTNILHQTLQYTSAEPLFAAVMGVIPHMSNTVGLAVAGIGAFIAWFA